MKIVSKITAFLIFGGTGYATVWSFYKYALTAAFWAGFVFGVCALIVICAIMIGVQTDKAAGNVSKFFMDLRTRQMHKRIVKRNSEI